MGDYVRVKEKRFFSFKKLINTKLKFSMFDVVTLIPFFSSFFLYIVCHETVLASYMIIKRVVWSEERNHEIKLVFFIVGLLDILFFLRFLWIHICFCYKKTIRIRCFPNKKFRFFSFLTSNKNILLFLVFKMRYLRVWRCMCFFSITSVPIHSNSTLIQVS